MKPIRCYHHVAFLWIALSFAPAFAASFQPLGDLPGGSFESGAWSVSADGSVVVGESISASGTEAFRWTGGMVGLGDLPGGIFSSSARDVSGDGSVTVGKSVSASSTDEGEAFRHTSASGMVGLGYLGGPEYWSIAEAVSYDGTVIVGRTTDGVENRRTAFRWTASEGMVKLTDPSGASYQSFARAISTDNRVIVGDYTPGPTPAEERMAFRWTSAEGFVSLGHIPGTDFHSSARACSTDGGVIAGNTGFYEQVKDGDGEYPQSQAFRWTEAGGMVGLGDLPGGAFVSWALSASSDVSVVVGYSKTEVAKEAFIWDSVNGMRNLKDVLTNTYGLDLSGWTLNAAQGISADGMTIVGTGTNPSGQYEAWLVDLADTNAAEGFLLFDDFSTTLAQWSVRGQPLPSIVSGEGNPSPCFSTNGDDSYDSLAVSKKELTYAGINFNVSADMKAGGLHKYATLALTKTNTIGGSDTIPVWQPIVAVNLLANQHASGPGVILEIHYDDNGEKIENSGVIPVPDGDGWHNILFRVREGDGKVELYCDSDMIHTSLHSLTPLYSGTAAIGLGNRLAWHDNVKVFSENADFDQDGDVDGTDLWLFRQHFVQAAAPADLSKDNQVDGLDVKFFGANLGKPY